MPKTLTQEQRERKRAADRARYAQQVQDPVWLQRRREACAERARVRRQQNPDAVRAAKQRYYASEKGRACKQREYAASVLNGTTRLREQRRSAKPLTLARKQARATWDMRNKAHAAYSRMLSRDGAELLAFDRWVAREAHKLARLREALVGGKWHVDHVVPLSRGGSSHATNLQVVPAIWNRRKGNRTAERFFGA